MTNCSLGSLLRDLPYFLTSRIAADPALLDAIGPAPEPDSDGHRTLAAEGQRCITSTDLAPAFVASLDTLADEPLDDNARRCATNAYANLDDEDRRSLLTSGLDPTASHTDDGLEIIRQLLASCGIRLGR